MYPVHSFKFHLVFMYMYSYTTSTRSCRRFLCLLSNFITGILDSSWSSVALRKIKYMILYQVYEIVSRRCWLLCQSCILSALCVASWSLQISANCRCNATNTFSSACSPSSCFFVGLVNLRVILFFHSDKFLIWSTVWSVGRSEKSPRRSDSCTTTTSK